jgi:peptidoglycan biosynthesis protein MviN/MurJ (putative lipid II flippase)
MTPLELEICLFLAKFVMALFAVSFIGVSIARIVAGMNYARQHYGKRPFVIFAALIVAVVLALTFAALPAHSQTAPHRTPSPRLVTNLATGTHYVQWAWTAPATGASAYNVYQAIGTCASPSTFTLLAAAVATTNWQQSPVPTSTTCTYVTALSAVGVEGLPSLSFQLDLTPPGAPGQPTPAYH